jgi:hypothetical protein
MWSAGKMLKKINPLQTPGPVSVSQCWQGEGWAGWGRRGWRLPAHPPARPWRSRRAGRGVGRCGRCAEGSTGGSGGHAALGGAGHTGVRPGGCGTRAPGPGSAAHGVGRGGELTQSQALPRRLASASRPRRRTRDPPLAELGSVRSSPPQPLDPSATPTAPALQTLEGSGLGVVSLPTCHSGCRNFSTPPASSARGRGHPYPPFLLTNTRSPSVLAGSRKKFWVSS